MASRRAPGLGRCERALNEELGDRGDVGAAERAALRVCARALDRAEKDGDARQVCDGSKIYLELRRAAGLVAGERPAAGGDPFVAFAAGLSAAGVGNAAHRE